MNVVLLSPHFPPNFYLFAVALRRLNVNVFGIGDAPHGDLRPELHEALTEYYWVDNMHAYDRLLRACAYLTFQYGKLDRLESHNEYWLETDAHLRTDFNIQGLKLADIAQVKRKSAMKQIFQAGGVEAAPGRVARTLEEGRALLEEIGYPVIAKPDIGVGAAGTYKIRNDAELQRFFAEKPAVDYMLEGFIAGVLHSFDGLTDQQGRPVFYTGHFYKPDIMQVVNQDLDVHACSLRQIPEGLEHAGMRALRAFDVRERFFHIEFFRAHEDGRWIAVEMNMRPPGGVMLDVMNFANDVDLYQQWANITVFNTFTAEYTRPYHCTFIGRKHRRHYRHPHAEILARYGPLLMLHRPVTPLFRRAMGDYAYLLRSPDMETLQEAIDFILEVQEDAADAD